MTEEEKRASLLLWARKWTNNSLIEEVDIMLFLEQGLQVLKGAAGISSESLGDYSVSFKDNPITELAKEHLRPFRKVKIL